ncbi:MAG: aminotransferase class I/II-fold pyridoxal phosphate-dependent enzyme [bacterium]
MRPKPFALERFFARHEFGARYLLSTSDCQGLAMADLIAGAAPELRKRWGALSLGYTESQGLPELRHEIAGLYQGVHAEEIMTAAPEEAVFLAMNAVLEPGDHVVCTFPGYQSLYQLALSIGCEVTFWEPSEQKGWHFDPDRLEGHLRPDTKLVVWNFPHNPTGALPSLEDLSSMVASVRAVGAWVFSDEMYRLLEPSVEMRLPAAVDKYERAISLSGMSKAFGLAGLRIGWVATHDMDLLERMKALKDYTTICSSAPSELLALMALRSREGIVGAHRERVRRNVDAAADFFARHEARFHWTPPRAGTVCFPRMLPEPLGAAVPGAEEFCARVLMDTGVLLLPSTVYGYGDEHFRIGLGREDFEEGLGVLNDYVLGLGSRRPPGSRVSG